MERNRGGTNSPRDGAAQTQEACCNGRSLAWVKESMAAFAPALEEQELVDQVKAWQTQSSTKRSAQRARAPRSARRGLRGEIGGREMGNQKVRVRNRSERKRKWGRICR